MIEKIQSLVIDSVYEDLPSVMDRFLINTPLRLAHFLSQADHESSNFKRTTENLNYSEAGLVKIFSKYFPTIEITKEYAHNQERIANKVYASRMGNGDENSGDGWKFKGRGYFQLTGKNNYADFDKIVAEDILNHPEMVSTKYCLLSAAWFWGIHKLNVVADLGKEDEIVKKITKNINGGLIGIEARLDLFKKYYSKLLN